MPRWLLLDLLLLQGVPMLRNRATLDSRGTDWSQNDARLGQSAPHRRLAATGELSKLTDRQPRMVLGSHEGEQRLPLLRRLSHPRCPTKLRKHVQHRPVRV